jgi:hypothetical protein
MYGLKDIKKDKVMKFDLSKEQQKEYHEKKDHKKKTILPKNIFDKKSKVK